MKPHFAKPDTKKKHKKSGAKKGHVGHSKTKVVDAENLPSSEHKLESCPDCGKEVTESTKAYRKRYIIDIGFLREAETTVHNIHRHWCPYCKDMKEPIVTAALPGCNYGINTTIYSAIQHYLKGTTISKVCWNLEFFGMKNITEGALISQWHAIAALLKPEFEKIKTSIHNETGSVNADETGHRQKGVKFWTWLAASCDKVLVLIRRHRDAISAQALLGNDFKGILCTDFLGAYFQVNAKIRQFCIRHFLNEFEKIEVNRIKPPPEYFRFKLSMKRLIYAAMKFAKRENVTLEERNTHYARYLRRLDAISACKYKDKDVLRLIKRIKRTREGLFTFVRIQGVEPTNNFAEQQIRPSVIIRKNSFHTMSDLGSETHSILMTIFMTLELQKKDVFEETKKLVQLYIQNQSQKDNLAVAA